MKTQANKTPKPNKKESKKEQSESLCSEIPEWLQEFRENLVDDEIPEHGDSHATSSHEVCIEPKLKRREDLCKHSVFSHFPKDRNCEICQRTKITRPPCRRRNGGAVLRAENFGDLITADHKVLSDNCESRNNHRYAVVVAQAIYCSRQSLLARGLPFALVVFVCACLFVSSVPQTLFTVPKGWSKAPVLDGWVQIVRAPARSRSVGHMRIQRSTMSVDEFFGQEILFSNPDSPVVRRRLGSEEVRKLEAAVAALGGENNAHAKPLFDALKTARAQSKVLPVQERMDSCRKFVGSAQRRVMGEEVITKATEQKEAFLLEVEEAEHRLKRQTLDHSLVSDHVAKRLLRMFSPVWSSS